MPGSASKAGIWWYAKRASETDKCWGEAAQHKKNSPSPPGLVKDTEDSHKTPLQQI